MTAIVEVLVIEIVKVKVIVIMRSAYRWPRFHGSV